MYTVNIIKKLNKSTIGFKRMIIPVVMSIFVFVFVLFYTPIVNRIIPDYTVIIQNYSNMDLNNLAIETTQGENLLNFNSISDSIDTYKVTKRKVSSNTAYNIVYKNLGTVQSSELISFD